MNETFESQEYEEWEGEFDESCQTCGGDGFVWGYELNDPLWYDRYEMYTCENCGGSGKAKDQTYW